MELREALVTKTSKYRISALHCSIAAIHAQSSETVAEANSLFFFIYSQH